MADRWGGRPEKEIKLNEVEAFAGKGLSVQEISACLGISDDQFYKLQKESEEFKLAVNRGRAKAVSKMAGYIVEIAEQCYDEPHLRLRAAEIYLKRHGDLWKEQTKVEVQHSGSVDVNNTFSEKDLTRIAETFLKLKGD